MGQEIELKLAIAPQDRERLRNHPFILRYADAAPVVRQLANIYYDTPDWDMRAHRMALRLRFDGAHYIQTLKKAGTVRDGLTERGEWEWVLPGAGLDLSLIPEELWPKARPFPNLAPVFNTDFLRTAWHLMLPAGSLLPGVPGGRIELALDVGEIKKIGRVDSSRELISEVELELLEGEKSMLQTVSGILSQDLSLRPMDLSKAQRGYRLLIDRSME